MKRLTIFLLLAALLVTAAGALAAQTSPETAARSVVPTTAELLRTRTEGGLLRCYFSTEDGTRYEVHIDPATTTVVHVDVDPADQRGGASVALTPEAAESALMAVYPEASIHLVQQDRDDGRYHYDVHFSTGTFLGRAEINAQTGALMDAELDYSSAAGVEAQGPVTAEEAKALALSLVTDGLITDFETDRENGRTVYEGEIRAGSTSYDFVIDAETGRFIEWETEK